MKSTYAEIIKFIPDLEQLESAGEWVTSRPDSPGVQHMPHVSYEPLIYAFIHAMTPFWAGVDDVYHNPLKAYADANAFPFLSAPGNHVSAMLQPDIDTINSICLFITRANAGTEA